jgi:hypothetical protein
VRILHDVTLEEQNYCPKSKSLPCQLLAKSLGGPERRSIVTDHRVLALGQRCKLPSDGTPYTMKAAPAFAAATANLTTAKNHDHVSLAPGGNVAGDGQSRIQSMMGNPVEVE